MTPSLTPQNARVLNDHLAWMRLRELRPATLYHRRLFVTRLAGFADSRPLLELTEDDLDRWQRDQARLQPRSRLCGISNVTSFYRWCVQYDLRPDDPSRVLIRPKRPKAVPHPISEEDLELALAGAPRRVYPMLVLGAYAGLRVGEIAGLERQDVRDHDDPPVLVVHGKGGKTRIVPMSDIVLDALRAHGLAGRGPVFGRLDGGRGPNEAWTISHLIARYLHELGISETAHSLRHRFGTRLYKETQDLRLVQELMGHESPLTTAGYVEWSRLDAVDAVSRITRPPGRREPTRRGPGGRGSESTRPGGRDDR